MSKHLLFAIALLLAGAVVTAQPSIEKIFPEGTVFQRNIAYAGDTLKAHRLDIYLPPNAKPDAPLVVWIHGGAWMLNDKYADMGYMTHTIKAFMDSGYALASIDYRYSTTAVFPAQIKDCNRALQFLSDHAKEYHLDNKRIALIGFSAGGHLASLIGLSNNNHVKEFFPGGQRTSFAIRCVLDFYGPSDLIAIASGTDTSVNNDRDPESLLLGAHPLTRPDLARRASPTNYVDKNDPPFFIVHGEKDQSVPNTQSRLLSGWLTLAGVPNELTIVPGAPHFGEMFDADWIRAKLLPFLSKHFR